MQSAGRTLVIAEAGVNHNGSAEMAMKLVDAAAAAGADAVKFQSFRAEALVSIYAPKAQYQLRSTGADESQLDMLRRLELSEEAHRSVISRARSKGLRFLSTPFDLESLAMLVDRYGLETIKIASGEITNGPLLLRVGGSKRNAILSTGMSTLAEVEVALGVLAFGYVAGEETAPSLAAFAAAYASDVGQAALREHVSLLHCTSEYPSPAEEVNLRALDTLAAFGLPVGLSDHTRGIHIPVAAVARGASIIEKHFTLDRTLPGPDHAASLEPGELAEMIAAIRDVERAFGDGVKRPTPSELKNRDVARKSLVAAHPLKAGQRIAPEDLTAKRPGTGVSPLQYWERCGRLANRDYDTDESLDP